METSRIEENDVKKARQELYKFDSHISSKLQELNDIKLKMTGVRKEGENLDKEKELQHRLSEIERDLKRINTEKSPWITIIRKQLSYYNNRIQEARDEFQAKETDLIKLRGQLFKLQATKDKLSRSMSINDSEKGKKLLKDIEKIEKKIEKKTTAFTNLRATYSGIIVTVVNLINPRNLIETLDDSIPILLFPVRLETRFVNDDSTNNEPELWVRFFPDEISIETHEELLTEDEIIAGKDYWEEIWRTGGDKKKEIAAWRALVAEEGTPRAAWIAKMMEPTNQNFRPQVPISEDDRLDPAPLFPDPETHESSWTRAPRSCIMPDCFVVTTYIGDDIVHEVTGFAIPDPLIVGPDPLELEEEGFRRDKDKLHFGSNIDWLADFQKAKSVGMAVSIKLTPDEATNGFDKVIALGIKFSAGDQGGKNRLEELFNNHHYSEGLSLLPIGTPTNLTEDSENTNISQEIDAEISYFVEQKEPIFTHSDDNFEKCDSQRLTEALGIDEAVFHHIYHSHQVIDNETTGEREINVSPGYDGLEAQAMNRALWSATLGYYMEELMNPLFSLDTIRETRHFFTRYISARGLLPTIRVGDQPYGILPTTAFSRWEWPIKYTSEFLQDFHSTLNLLDSHWKTLSDGVTYTGKSNDLDADILDILGLHATSVEIHQRRGVGSKYIWNLQSFLGWTDENETWNEYLKFLAYKIVDNLGLNFTDVPKILDLSFFTQNPTLTGPLVEEDLPSESKQLKPITPEIGNFISWLLTTSIGKIRNEDFGLDEDENQRPPPKSLLYLLLRHALLLSYWNTAMLFNVIGGVLGIEARRENELVNMGPEPDICRWNHFNQVVPEIGGGMPIGDVIQTNMIVDRSEAQELLEVKGAFTKLQDLPTARLQRLLFEHLDLCSYRLDAWQLGIVNLRLQKQRLELNEPLITPRNEPKRHGIYLGSFGILENVRPRPPCAPVPDIEIPDGFNDSSLNPLKYVPDNAGFMIAPSLNHAATFSVLRNAYITHKTTETGELMSMNLSSQRVRRALDYFDGINNGQELAALLGYKFERGLHDRDPSLFLDQYLLEMREAFPFVADQITESEDNDSIEALESCNVVNGLDLVRTARKKRYPYGVEGLPSTGSQAANVIQQVVDQLLDDLDAVGDLALAEGVWQVAQGNFDRSGAIMKAMTEGGNIPKPEIIDTPRSGFGFTHRVTLNFTENSTSTNPWFDIPMSPRAQIEACLNYWISTIIGSDPDKIRCLVEFTDSGGNDQKVEVSLKNLNLQPLDFLYIMKEDLQGQATELEQRIAYYVRSNYGLTLDIPLRILFIERKSTWSLDVLTFFEILPLLNNLREIIVGSRSLSADDLFLPSDDEDESDLIIEERTRYDVTELRLRVEGIKGRLESVLNGTPTDPGLKNEVDNTIALDSTIAIYPANQFDNLRKRLFDASHYGIYNAIPQSAIETTLDVKNELIEQGKRVIQEIEKRLLDGQNALDAIDSSSNLENQVETLSEIAQKFFNGSYKIIPYFTLINPLEVIQALSHVTTLLQADDPLPVETWLQGLTRVRPKIKAYEMVRLMADMFENNKSSLTVVQLPFSENERWLGLPLPADQKFESEKVSIIMQIQSTYDPEHKQAGLVLDEWSETIPSRKESLGVTFHYNQPNSEPPQTLLLAVTPKETGHWDWDDLMTTILDTLQLAKKRAVDPDKLNQTGFAQFLPALLMASVEIPETIRVDFARLFETGDGAI